MHITTTQVTPKPNAFTKSSLLKSLELHMDAEELGPRGHLKKYTEAPAAYASHDYVSKGQPLFLFVHIIIILSFWKAYKHRNFQRQFEFNYFWASVSYSEYSSFFSFRDAFGARVRPVKIYKRWYSPMLSPQPDLHPIDTPKWDPLTVRLCTSP